MEEKTVPGIFRQMILEGFLEKSDLFETEDGFYLVYKSLSDILSGKDIFDFPDTEGKTFSCKNFFDDWYLYCVLSEGFETYSLFKMREQESDAKNGILADGDVPGVTVSFIEFDAKTLTDCLREPSFQNRMSLGEEIGRVTYKRNQRHSKRLKQYFVRTESRGAYLIAELYTKFIASLSENGFVAVPEHYDFCYKNKKGGRVARFIEKNNREAGKNICDHQKIFIENPDFPTEREKLAILATHTGNVSFFSFAAEVQFHAKFLAGFARIKLPVIGKSLYESAIRADMSIGDFEFQGFAPYYREKSHIVRLQTKLHSKRR